ncbi:16S rRNA (guanine(527)-N(7))-methyltransferase RsmG [Dictyoglomus thermophilum]|uniref:Ribosomal RNA small subunit methyltransferase G n=1 Tax=Dictyoglomus thermophilum (strain ATCC 35947 / DSM 3960 / H-6-12) TaxID=309799 RepID=RSMG_DICT6|nr:16S rRNA (guanine(527)-N(7))-methyltransferase RsmG [Dictyoglomus thermophilum]B5YFF7.1 RecName: Full=Ribosomal RNA small subunit methyltransferase G; AltName: Full=16S rRNA 7-methylguanosine methyltransferase; Short=16S rRNA m7G methyltransferase [Dictyoglomus thermophilum H-6-12]ACI18940.1 methyltransferase GidB [Dictyoglomus thermophilum H-6-12]
MEENFKRILREKVSELNLSLDPLQEEKFYLYYMALKEWNRKINLTSLEGEEEIILKHFVDSLSCIIPIRNENIERIIDIGTGAGFPGIPIKIYDEKYKLTLLESQKKKILFLEELIKILELSDVEIVWDRAENLGKDPRYREQFDLALARGVAKPNIVLEYALPFVKTGGIFLGQATPNNLSEWENAQKVVGILGGKTEEKIEINFDNITRIFLKIRKINNTPEKYPRRPGIPEKRPLLP